MVELSLLVVKRKPWTLFEYLSILIACFRLWFASFQTQNKPLVDHVTKLNAVRKACIAADSKFLSTQVRMEACRHVGP